MKTRQWTILSSVLFCCLGICDCKKHPREAINPLLTNVELKPNTHLLEIVLSSNSNNALKLRRASLPWEAWYSFTLVLVKSQLNGVVIPQVTPPIQDPDATFVSIPPHTSISGIIDLDLLYPGLTEILQSKDVIVFWSYEPKPMGEQAMTRVGGWFLIGCDHQSGERTNK